MASQAVQSKTSNPNERYFYIQTYHIAGGENLLSRLEIEEAVYPFLGPYRTNSDVEGAANALQSAFRDKGYQLVTVEIAPGQHITNGKNVIFLQVNLNKVGRLRVLGSRYFSIEEIEHEAPSMASGKVLNYNDVTRDNFTLNQFPDRHVSPIVHAGVLPNTVDVDLNVKDTPPVHSSLEINNRYSADTAQLRLNGSAEYDNLWQLGHSIGATVQVSPEAINEVAIFSGFYLARIPGMPWLSLMFEGSQQNSNVNTLSGAATSQPGQTIGLRAIFSLPQQNNFYHSLSLGFDYRHTNLSTSVDGTPVVNSPLTYFPFTAAYSATWMGKDYETDLDSSVNFHIRNMGNTDTEFAQNRQGATAGYIYFRGDLSHKHDLPGGLQIYGKIQGQMADEPLVSSEEFSAGGLGTVRGYLEGEEQDDNGLLGTVELRSPSLSSLISTKTVDEWRFYTFFDGGFLTRNNPGLDEQRSVTLSSVGVGSDLKVQDHYNGTLDLGFPLDELHIYNGDLMRSYGPHLTFRVWADF
ncbi:MAG TPA: ShlB/FhaC/HecB family hemolysin secretion/activation protein [Candidatus Methylacidiphilales bacterium]|nr:ShlB/FhaC/HecB family hemolysin secretion/activation protein [Candidatus Methylacidiphilales bacterium]